MTDRPNLAKLLQMAGLEREIRTGNDRRVSRVIAAKTFATAYLQSFNPRKAYQALRPQAKLSGRKTNALALQWFSDRLVQQNIATLMLEAKSKATLDFDALLRRIQEAMDSSLVPFFDVDEPTGQVKGFQINVRKLTTAQLRNIRSLKVGKDGKILELSVHDPNAAVDQAMRLAALMRVLQDPSAEAGTIAAKLTKALEDAARQRQLLLERLPAPKVRNIIEHEATRKS